MFIDFVRAHYELIISVVVLLISIFLTLIKKKPVSGILGYICVFAMEATKIVEKSGIKGPSEKLASAIQIVNQKLINLFPDIDIGIYGRLICKIIENILETPQKK